MTNNNLILRVEIDGKWSVSEMSLSLKYVNDIYNISQVLTSDDMDYGIYSPFSRPYGLPYGFYEDVLDFVFTHNDKYLFDHLEPGKELSNLEIRISEINYSLEKNTASLVRKHLLKNRSPFFFNNSESVFNFENEFLNLLRDNFLNLFRDLEKIKFIERENIHKYKEDLYSNVRKSIERLRYKYDDIYLGSPDYSALERYINPENKLRVVAIQYASPGVQDFAGAGKAIEHLTDFLKYIIDKVSDRKKKRLEEEKQEIENEKARVEVAKAREEVEKSKLENKRLYIQTSKEWVETIIDIKDKLNDSQKDNIVEYVNILENHFVELASEEKITNVKLIERK